MKYARYTIVCQCGDDNPLPFAKHIEIDPKKEKRKLNASNIVNYVKSQILKNRIQMPKATTKINIYEQWFSKSSSKDEECVETFFEFLDLIYVGDVYNLEDAEKEFGKDSQILDHAKRTRAKYVVRNPLVEDSFSCVKDDDFENILDVAKLQSGYTQ